MRVADAFRGVRQVFLDTAPVIYHVEGVTTYQAVTDWVFQQISAGVFRAITSPVTLAECLVQPCRRGDSALIQQFRNVVTAGVNTQFMAVDQKVAESAAELRAKYNLTLTDALQVAVAIAAGCDALLTNDTAFQRVQELTILLLAQLQP